MKRIITLEGIILFQQNVVITDRTINLSFNKDEALLLYLPEFLFINN